MAVLTAATAIVKVNSTTVGYLTGVTINQDWSRGRVKGIGKVTAYENPLVDFNGTLTCDSSVIDLVKTGLNANKSDAELNDSSSIIKSYLYAQKYTIDLYKKTPTVTTDGVVSAVAETSLGSIIGAELTSENISISEGQVTTGSQSFVFINPIAKTTTTNTVGQ